LLIASSDLPRELVRDVEMILERTLAASGHEDDLLDPRLERFLDGILDQRLVDDGEHFLRHGFGGRKEARTQSGNWKHGLAQRLYGHSMLPLAVRRLIGSVLIIALPL